MGRKVIKLIPDRMIFVGKIESWLKDMAKHGLILKKLNLSYAIFEEDELQDYDYRIAAFKNSQVTDELIDEIKQNGWIMVNKRVGLRQIELSEEKYHFYVFRSTMPDNTNDLCNDLNANKFLYTKYKKIRKANCLSFIFSAIFTIIFAYIPLKGIAYNLVPIINSVMYAIMSFLFFIITFSESFRLRKLNEDYYIYNTNKYDEDWEHGLATIRIKQIMWSFLVVLFIFTKINDYYYDFGGLVMEDKGSPSQNCESYIYLSDIETYESGFVEGEMEYIESPRTDGYHQLLMPIYYETFTDGYFFDKDGEKISAFYYLHYGKPIFSFFSKNAYRDWVDDYSNNSWIESEAIELETDYFSEAVYFINDEEHFNIGMYGENEFLCLMYMGDKTPQEVLEAIEHKLEK